MGSTDTLGIFHEGFTVILTLELPKVKIEMYHLMCKQHIKVMQIFDINRRNCYSHEVPAPALYEVTIPVFISRNVESDLITMRQWPTVERCSHTKTFIGGSGQLASYMDPARHLTNPYQREIFIIA